MAEIPKIVGQRLQAMAKLDDHPDANLLGAFAEKSLGKRERIDVLEHLSQCTSCREMVALSAVGPEIAHAAALAGSGWVSWPALRWAAVAACVVVVGAVVTLRQKQEVPQMVATVGQPVAGAQLPAPNSATEKNGTSLQVPIAEAKAALAAKPAASQLKAKVPNPADGNYAVDASPVEMADARTSSQFVEMVPGRAKDASAELEAAQEKAVGGPLVKKRMTAASAGAATIVSNAFIPANLTPRWTLSSDGTLQRSLDSGRTWQTIPVSSPTIFRALAANGLDIWVGGAGGALFHSSDAGQHWIQVRPVVNGETLTDDIIGVEFTDTLHGKLTTSSEETWITADAGQTWRKQ
jgi:hypothetical protein